MGLTYRGQRNLERLLSCLRDNGAGEVLEGEVDRRLLEEGDPRPTVLLLRVVVCAVSLKVLERYYVEHEWFLVPVGDVEFVDMVWAVLGVEYGYVPRLSSGQFAGRHNGDVKIAILADILRIVENHHNDICEKELTAADYDKTKQGWIHSTNSRSPPPSRRKTQNIQLNLKMNTVGDLEKSLSPRIPFDVRRRPGKSNIKKGYITREVVETERNPAASIKIIGGKIVGDVVEQSFESRTSHPDYTHYVVEGLVRPKSKRTLFIPDHSVFDLRCCDGVKLLSSTNAGIPLGQKLCDHNADLTFSTISTDDVVSTTSETSPEPTQQPLCDLERIYIKKFPAMLDRAVVKKVKIVAPPTCPKEQRDMVELFNVHKVDPPEVHDGCERTFWMQRSGILHRLKQALKGKYPGYRVVLHDPPEDDGKKEDEVEKNEDFLSRTVGGRGWEDLGKGERGVILQGMKWTPTKTAATVSEKAVQTTPAATNDEILSAISSLTSLVTSFSSQVEELVHPPSFSSSSSFFSTTASSLARPRKRTPLLLQRRPSVLSSLKEEKHQPSLRSQKHTRNED